MSVREYFVGYQVQDIPLYIYQNIPPLNTSLVTNRAYHCAVDQATVPSANYCIYSTTYTARTV